MVFSGRIVSFKYGCNAAASLLVLIESLVLYITWIPNGTFIGVGVLFVVLNLPREDLYNGRSNLPVFYLKADLGLIRSILVFKLSKLFVIAIFPSLLIEAPSTDFEWAILVGVGLRLREGSCSGVFYLLAVCCFSLIYERSFYVDFPTNDYFTDLDRELEDNISWCWSSPITCKLLCEPDCNSVIRFFIIKAVMRK